MSDAAQTTPRAGVQSVDRALDILEALAAEGGTLGVTDVARLVGLPQGTTHRLLAALTVRGWVRRDAARRYGIGSAAVRLGDAAFRELGASAGATLRAAVDATGETANLALLEGDHMVYVAQSPSPHTLRIFAEVGRRVPLHSTAVGKVALASMAEEQARALLAGVAFEPRTPYARPDAEALMADVTACRQQGWAMDDQEQEVGVRCVAVPVPMDGLVAALSVSGPVERMSVAHAQRVVPELRRLGIELAEQYRGAP